MSKLNKLMLAAAAFVLSAGLFTGAAYAEENKAGVITGDVVNMRETPSTSANVVTQLSQNTQVVILETSDGWYKVSVDNKTGWVFGQYVSVTAIVSGKINGNDVNFRKAPSTAADVIATLNEGSPVSILGRSGEWYKIKTEAGSLGWVNKNFVALSDVSVSRGSSEASIPEIAAPAEEGSTKQQLVAFAKKQLGVKYVWGGTSPKGFDCSGFVYYVYKNYGVTLNRVAADQAKQGNKISKGDLQMGDLVFFDTDGGHDYINHVGIYIGNGQFIHASSGSAHKVVTSSLSDGFYANAYMTARRILN